MSRFDWPSWREWHDSMTKVARLVSELGQTTSIEVASPQGLAGFSPSRPVEAFICSTEEGFSPLGAERSFLLDALDVSWSDICSVANWNRFENEQVSLVIVPSRRPDSALKGLILAASERSNCYKRFAKPRFGRPHRDFFYNVTYEAIAFARGRWEGRRLAMSHLTGCCRSGARDGDALVCSLEALGHYCDQHPDAALEYFAYSGCCIGPKDFWGVQSLATQFEPGHRPIETRRRTIQGYEVIDLHW